MYVLVRAMSYELQVTWRLYDCITDDEIASSVATVEINTFTVPVSVSFCPISGTLRTPNDNIIFPTGPPSSNAELFSAFPSLP